MVTLGTNEMPRTPDACPYRQPLPTPSGKATHACLLALGISGAENPALCAVNAIGCERCCQSAPPTAEDPNGIVASTLYKALQQIKNAGGVPGCDAATAAMMLPLVMRFLDVSSASLEQRAGGPRPHPCRHLGAQTGEQPCRTCRGSVRQKIFQCHHPRHQSTTIQQCRRCRDYKPRPPSQNVARWAVGMTTAPRAVSTLNRTLRSLRRAGWTERVHLFAEAGTRTWAARLSGGPLAIIHRKKPSLGAWPNFFLGLQELYLRQPDADAYLMVQDDVVFCSGLRDYLEKNLWPKGGRTGVVSLHTPSHLAPENGSGFFHANLGWSAWGAQAMIFPNAAARSFLSDPKVIEHRQKGILDGTKNVDSVIGDWCARTKHQFWMHAPSLTEHIGAASTLWPKLGLRGKRSSADFPGEKVQAQDMLEQKQAQQEVASSPVQGQNGKHRDKEPQATGAAPQIIPPPLHVPHAPSGHPVAVLCTHFNFAGYTEPRRNLRRFLMQCRSLGITVYGMEICLHGALPVTAGIPGWWIEHVSANGIIWQKEAAINELARRVPPACEILAWVDTDVWFERVNWRDRLIDSFENGLQVVQLFDHAYWMNKEGKVVERQPGTMAARSPNAHPGFAWAAHRDFWGHGPGLYDLALAGSGDKLLALSLANINREEWGNHLFAALGYDQESSKRAFEAWEQALRPWAAPRAGHIEGAVWHEWHGNLSSRQYVSRTEIVRAFKPEYIVRNPAGLLEWTEYAPTSMREGMREYFASRKEDG